ncbi:MAG: hypothetical protein ACOYI8_04400 [Christensenellales bacterium]|jgi:hypothetical protein
MAKKEKFEYIEGVESDKPIHVMLFSFLYALIFGAASIFPWMTLKDLLPILALALGMENSRATGAIYISSTLVLGVVCLSLFIVLWHRLEKNFDAKKSLATTLKWSIIAIIVGVVALVAYSWLESMKVAV